MSQAPDPLPPALGLPAPNPVHKAELGLAVLSGLLLALSFPGVDLGFLAWVALVPLFTVAFKPRHRRGMMALFASFGIGFYGVLLYWFFAMHPLTWLGFTETASLGIVTLAWGLATGALIVQLLIFGLIMGWLTQAWDKPGPLHVLAFAFGWTALEWITSLGTFGFTWGNLALSQVGFLPVIQVLDLVGPFPLAGLIVAVNGAIALAWARRAEPLPARLGSLGGALAALGLVLAYGGVKLSQPLPATTFSAAIIQGNLAGSEKWTREKDGIYKMAEKYERLTASKPGTDLVLWPETAMPEFLRNNPRLLERLTADARAQKRHLMFGTLDWEGQGPDLKLYNAVTLLTPDGQLEGFSYKRHLVPYGEYVPARSYMPAFVLAMNIVGHDYFPGVDPHIFQTPYAKIGTGVCYDGIFPDAIRPAVLNGAEVLALVTNDAWYKDTTAPRVLLAHAALRAVENHRYVLRAANTGISAVIEPTGNIVVQTPVFEDAAIEGRAAPLRDLTIYTRFGDWLAVLASLGFLGFLGMRWTRRRPTT
jgi:apolipoprotein N-acyltransferase